MKNKVIIIILSILFFVSLFLGIIGILTRSNGSLNTTPPALSNSIKVVEYNNDVRDIISLDEKIKNFEFVKANKEFDSGYIKLYIDGDLIKIDVQKNGINSATEEMENIISYKIDNIVSVVAVQGQLSSGEGNKISAYALDKYGRLFLSTFNCDPSFFNNIETYMYNVNNIVSFTTLNIPLTEDNYIEQNYVIFKTNDGSYYTDYMFDTDGELKISKINNITIENNLEGDN